MFRSAAIRTDREQKIKFEALGKLAFGEFCYDS